MFVTTRAQYVCMNVDSTAGQSTGPQPPSGLRFVQMSALHPPAPLSSATSVYACQVAPLLPFLSFLLAAFLSLSSSASSFSLSPSFSPSAFNTCQFSSFCFGSSSPSVDPVMLIYLKNASHSFLLSLSLTGAVMSACF